LCKLPLGIRLQLLGEVVNSDCSNTVIFKLSVEINCVIYCHGYNHSLLYALVYITANGLTVEHIMNVDDIAIFASNSYVNPEFTKIASLSFCMDTTKPVILLLFVVVKVASCSGVLTKQRSRQNVLL
jgi:hypothetical protein